MATQDFILNCQIMGLPDLESLKKSLGSLATKSIPAVQSASSKMLKLSTAGILGLKGLATSFVGLGINAAAEYNSMLKSAETFSGSSEKGKVALDNLTASIKNSGVEIEQASRKMNAFLASGVDPKLAANLGLAAEYLEQVNDEAASATGHLQDLATGAIPLVATQIEDMSKGLGISKKRLSEMLGLKAEPKSYEEWDDVLKEVNKDTLAGKKLFEKIAQSSEMSKIISTAKNSGSAIDILKNQVNSFMMEISKGVDTSKITGAFDSLLSNKELMQTLSQSITSASSAFINWANNGGIQTVSSLISILANNFNLLIYTAGTFLTLSALFKTIEFGGNLITGIKSAISWYQDLNRTQIIARANAIMMWAASLGPILAVIAGITAVVAVGVLLYQNWDKVKEYASMAWDWIKNVFVPGFISAMKFLGEVLLWAFFPIPMLIAKYWTEITGFFGSVASWFADIFSPSKWSEIGINIIKGLINGLKGAAGWLYDSISGIASGALNKFKDVFGVHSPSKEMYAIGEYNMQGLQYGQEDYSGKVLRSTKDISGKVLSAANQTTNNSNTINIAGDKQEILSALQEFFGDLNMQMGAA